MKLLSALLIVLVFPLAGCAGTDSVADAPRNFEDLPRTYIVFFAVDSAALDEAARGVIAQAAEDNSQYRPMTIEIASYSEEGPNARVSAELAERRFSAVANALISEGFDASRIARSELLGAQDLPDLAAHRIEIRIELP